jgi:hypothetical protein
MRKFLQFGVGVAILFAVSVGASLVLRKPGKDGDDYRTTATASRPDGKNDGDPKAAPRGARPNPEETTSAMQNLRDREKAVRDRDEALNKRQKNLELVAQEVRDERAKLDDLRKQIQAELQEVGKKSTAMAAEARKADLERQREAATRDETLVHEQERRQAAVPEIVTGGPSRDESVLHDKLRPPEASDDQNIASLAVKFDNQQPSEVAAALGRLAQADLDTAVKVLVNMKNAQGVLRMMDPRVANDLSERMRFARGPAAVAPPPPPFVQPTVPGPTAPLPVVPAPPPVSPYTPGPVVPPGPPPVR